MKFNKVKIILAITVFILLSLKANISYAEIINGQIVGKDKVWSIKFNKDVSWNSIAQSSIVVVDESGNYVNISVVIGSDKRTIIVKPPMGGYLNGKSYTLKVDNAISTEGNGEKLKNSVDMTFSIDNGTSNQQNTNTSNEDEIKAGNLQSAGVKSMIEYKGYIYYRDEDNYSELYKMKEDGSDKQLVSHTAVMGNMWLDGHNLYYKTLFSSAIVKLDLDTNKGQYVNIKSETEGNTTHFFVEEIPSILVVKDNWIYFTQNDVNFGLYKMKNDATGKVKLADNVDNFSVDGNVIYYKDKENHLNKMQLDGSNVSQIVSEEIADFYVLGNSIFYNDFNNSCIKRINTDGSSSSTVVSNPSNPFFYVGKFNIAGDSLYYINSENPGEERLSKVKLNAVNEDYTPQVVEAVQCDYIMELGNKVWYKRYGKYFCRVAENGENETVLDNQDVSFVGAYGDWIYYIERGQGTSAGGKIFKIKYDGTEKTLVLDKSVQNAEMDDNYIYYQADMGLHKCSKDGTNDTVLTEDYGFKTNYDLKLAGDWIYYVGCHNENGNYQNDLYRIKKDGTEKALVTARCSNLLAANEGYVYYVSEGDDNSKSLYETKNDGSSEEKISDIKTLNIKVQGDYIYFIDSSNYLYKKKSGEGEKPILVYGDENKKATSLSGIENGYLYFFNNETDEATAKDSDNLSRISVTDNKYTNILQRDGSGLDVENGYIYYLKYENKWTQL